MSEKQNFLSRISAVSVDRYRIVYLLMILLVMAGFFYYTILPRESKPEVVFPKIKVNVNYPGASPVDVEALITNRLEAVLSTVEDVEFMTSSSLAGRSEIQLDFFPEADIAEKLNEVNQAVFSIQDFPDEAEAPAVKVSTTANRAFMVLSLSGDLSPSELKTAADSLFDELLSIKGVNDVRMSGDRKEELRVTVDPARLAEFNLTMDSLVQAIRLRHKDTPAGDAILDGSHYYIRVMGTYNGADELGRTLINLPGGGTIFLKDLAAVEETYEPVKTYSRRSVNLGTDSAAMKSAITLSLYRDGGTDIIGPSQAVKDLISGDKAASFPEGLDIQVIQDDAVTVQEDLDAVLENAVSGLLIVVLVLFLFLGLREALITALIIPFSLFIAFFAMNSIGMTFNTMTLLAMIIALGLLVDNAIVVMENIAIYRERGLSRYQAARQGSAEVAPSIFAATLTTMVAFIPIAFMGGRIGLIVSVIPVTIIFIIGASLLIALTVTPTLSSRMLKKVHSSHSEPRQFSLARELTEGFIVLVLFSAAFTSKGRPGLLSLTTGLVMAVILGVRIFSRYKQVNLFDKIADLYRQTLTRLVSKKRNRVLVPLVTLFALVAVLSTLPLGLLKIELFPVMDESSLYITLTTPQYSTLEDTDQAARKIEASVLSLSGISSIYSEVGVDSLREAEVILNLKPREERSWTTKEMVSQLMKEFLTIPGIKVTIGTSAGGKTANSPVQIRLTGTGGDIESLYSSAGETLKLLAQVEGIGNPVTDIEPGYPEVQVLVRQLEAADLGLDSTTIGNLVKTVVNGQTAGTLLAGEQEIPIRFTITDDKLDSVQDLEKIIVTLKDGSRVPLTQVVSIAETSGIGTIRHNGGDRAVMLYAQLLPDANLKDIVNSFDRIAAEQGLPGGISYEWSGDAADLDSSFSEMTVNLIIALLAVFLILTIQFDSLMQSLVILLSVPMSVIGVFSGLLLTGNNFGLYAFMGVIALVGIAVNDAIVLVDTVNRNRSGGMAMLDALTDAGKSRFGPVLATTLTTIGGILPLAFKDENFAQLSITLISGLIASTVLTLVVLPTIYSIVEESKVRFKKVIPVFTEEEKG